MRYEIIEHEYEGETYDNILYVTQDEYDKFKGIMEATSPGVEFDGLMVGVSLNRDIPGRYYKLVVEK